MFGNAPLIAIGACYAAQSLLMACVSFTIASNALGFTNLQTDGVAL